MANDNFKVFVDASAGSLGALLSTVISYPIDLVKTRKQVRMKHSKLVKDGEIKDEVQDKGLFDICSDIVDEHGITGLFKGLEAKAIHTILSNFTYFYWYSFLKHACEKRTGSLTASQNLLIGSLAGAINMSITLPFEMITTRVQTCQSKDLTTHEIIKSIYEEDGIFGFWKGYLASLALVSNPAISYTVFDILKLHLQRHRMNKTQSGRLKSLTMLESFFLGAVAKAIATLITYPLIRAKILMQAQKKEKKLSKNSSEILEKDNKNEDLGGNLFQVLRKIGNSDGLTGYYKGCSAQLLNTVLRSALLLMTKEQITMYTMLFFYSMQRRKLQIRSSTLP